MTDESFPPVWDYKPLDRNLHFRFATPGAAFYLS
jgi:hypothetical protein